jgi:hypothetical protein
MGFLRKTKRSKSKDWLAEIMIMCPSGATCLPTVCLLMNINNRGRHEYSGADPGFKVRGAHLKNCAERREARTFLGYFV